MERKHGPNLADNATGVSGVPYPVCLYHSVDYVGCGNRAYSYDRVHYPGRRTGSVVWILAGSWGWHPTGWLVTEWGYHDFGSSSVVHMISGFFALGVLIHLGPRVGKYNADGTPNVIRGHSHDDHGRMMLIVVGFLASSVAVLSTR